MSAPFELSGWDGIRFEGADVIDFLQGQLTQDVDGPRETALAGWCSNKGRLRALGIWSRREDVHWLFLPREVAAVTIRGMTMYRLRSRVDIDLASDQGLCVAARLRAARTDDEPEAHVWLRHPSADPLEMGIVASGSCSRDGPLEVEFDRIETDGGVPAVYDDTVDVFVPQMVNLDLLGGIDFKKGCYVGQEVVARTQNLGRIKRRMFRYQTTTRPVAGDEVFSEGRKAGVIVRAAGVEDVSVLAVVRLEFSDIRLSTGDEMPASLEPLPMPYDVPVE